MSVHTTLPDRTLFFFSTVSLQLSPVIASRALEKYEGHARVCSADINDGYRQQTSTPSPPPPVALAQSLGGNTKTVMCANAGPAEYNYDETVSTLRYGAGEQYAERTALVCLSSLPAQFGSRRRQAGWNIAMLSCSPAALSTRRN